MKAARELFDDVLLPKELDTPAFREAWGVWTAYRRERHLPVYKPIGLKVTLRMLVEFGHDDAIKAIGHSMAQNYQGLVKPKETASGAKSVNGAKRKVSAWELEKRGEAIKERMAELKDGRKGMVYNSYVPGENPGYTWTPAGIAEYQRLRGELSELKRQLTDTE